MLNRQSFTPQVQSDSEHFDKESRHYLLSNSRENQSEDDSESTDDSFDRFTNHQVHLSTSHQWLCLSCMTVIWGFFLLVQLIEIISIANFWSLYTFFVLKHEKQTLSYFHTKFEGDKNNNFFFSNLFCGSTRFSARTLKITWTWEVDTPVMNW